MGISLKLENHNVAFLQSPVQPIILNDLASTTEEEKNFVDRVTSTRYETDLLSNEPVCECGELKGGYNIGVICTNCNTPVRDVFEQQLIPLVWIRSPRGVANLINPMVLAMLSQKFTKTGFNIIEWLCNTNYQPPINRPAEIDELLMLGIERGYNNFVNNFFPIVEMLFNMKSFKAKKAELDQLWLLLEQQKDCIFSEHLPLPNKSLLVVENTQVGIYVDPIIVGAVDAIRTMCSIDNPQSNFSVRQKENRTAKTLFTLVNFYLSTFHDILASKNGIFRKHIYGTRNNYSVRAVISSNTKAHAYDEIHIPWSAGVTMMKTHLMNKLMKMGYSPNEGTNLLQAATYKYNPLVDKLFHELLDESKDESLYIIFNRNPSLTRASCQRMRITKFKTDPDDPTISLK